MSWERGKERPLRLSDDSSQAEVSPAGRNQVRSIRARPGAPGSWGTGVSLLGVFRAWPIGHVRSRALAPSWIFDVIFITLFI